MSQTSQPAIAQRIGILLPSLAGGGAERVMLNLADELIRQGRDVDLLLFRREGPFVADVPAGCRVIELPAGLRLQGRLLAARANPRNLLPLLRPIVLARKPHGAIRHIAALRRQLEASPPDVIVGSMTYTNLVALWARALAGVPVPVVCIEHISLAEHVQPESMRPGWRWQHLLPMVRAVYTQADGIVAVSNSVADTLAASTGLRREQIRTIYNPVVDDRLATLAAEPLEHPWFAPGERPVVLGVGRLIPQKDFATLLRAFALLLERRAARLVILGEGRLRPSLEALAKELGIERYVELHGFAENPYRYMARAGVLALSSIYEGLPTVLIQALACASPVVSTDCPGGSAEILEGGRVGPLVAMRDPQALAAALDATLTRPPPAEALTARAEVFSIARASREYLSYLDGLVAAPGSAG